MEEENKTITISVELFSELIIQVGILKETYDKITISKQMNFFQRKVLLKNKQKNNDILKELEKVCEDN